MDGIFGIGFGELVMIAIVALIVLGPERLPSALREVAKFIRQVRNLSQEFTSQFGDDFKALEDLNPRRLLQEAIDNIDEEEKAKDGKAKTPAKKSTTPTTAAKKTTTPAKPAAAKNGVAKSTTASTTTGAATKSTDTAVAVTTKSDDAKLPAAQTDANGDNATTGNADIMTEKAVVAEPQVETTGSTSTADQSGGTSRTIVEPENQIAPPERADTPALPANVVKMNQPSLSEPSQEIVQSNGHAGSDNNAATIGSGASIGVAEDVRSEASVVGAPTEPTVEHNGQLESEEMRS